MPMRQLLGVEAIDNVNHSEVKEKNSLLSHITAALGSSQRLPLKTIFILRTIHSTIVEPLSNLELLEEVQMRKRIEKHAVLRRPMVSLTPPLVTVISRNNQMVQPSKPSSSLLNQTSSG